MHWQRCSRHPGLDLEASSDYGAGAHRIVGRTRKRSTLEDFVIIVGRRSVQRAAPAGGQAGRGATQGPPSLLDHAEPQRYWNQARAMPEYREICERLLFEMLRNWDGKGGRTRHALR